MATTKESEQNPDITAKALKERLKELMCLYTITNLSADGQLSLDEFLQHAVAKIPAGFQYPDLACARILYLESSYETENFQNTQWKVTSNLKTRGNKVGSIEVCYLQNPGQEIEDPFLWEEKYLVMSISSNIGIIIEKKLTEKELNHHISEQKRAEADLIMSKIELSSLASHLQNLREEERGRMASKVHGELRQILTVLNMDLALLSQKLSADQKEPLTLIAEIKETINHMIQTVQKISAELRPRLIDEVGLIPAVKWQANEFQRHAGIECELNIADKDINPDKKISIVLFRILQEALTNVARHAEASKVTVGLSAKPDGMILKIEDNGKGISEEQLSRSTSLGILGIRESVLSLSGKVEIMGVPDRGTTVKVSLPLENRI